MAKQPKVAKATGTNSEGEPAEAGRRADTGAAAPAAASEAGTAVPAPDTPAGDSPQGTHSTDTSEGGSGTAREAPGAGSGEAGDSSASGVKPAPQNEDAAAEKRPFTAKWDVSHDGEAYGPGDPIELTRAEFLPLKAAGAVEGDWPEQE